MEDADFHYNCTIRIRPHTPLVKHLLLPSRQVLDSHQRIVVVGPRRGHKGLHDCPPFNYLSIIGLFRWLGSFAGKFLSALSFPTLGNGATGLITGDFLAAFAVLLPIAFPNPPGSGWLGLQAHIEPQRLQTRAYLRLANSATVP